MLQADHIVIARAGRVLIQPLSVQIKAGRITIILGSNGVGKSSLMLALAGMLPLAGGQLMLQEKTLSAWTRREIAARIAWQGTLPPVEFGLTVAQRLELAADGRNMPDMYASLDIESLMSCHLGALSTGERQRVELAAALVRNCRLLLMDEPTAHLDLKYQCRCLELMREQAKSGKAVVAVLHDIQQAVSVADDVILLFKDRHNLCGEATTMLATTYLESLFDVTILHGATDGIIPDYGRLL